MKKVIPGFICLLLLISSCGFETPESITIKGKPDLYVPVGSPFAGMAPEERLEYLISSEHIKEMIQASSTSSASDPKIYELNSNTSNVLTYLVEYQLADIPLNLEEYMDEAIDDTKSYTIPKVDGQTGAFPAGTYRYINGDGVLSNVDNDPFLKIRLDNMVKFVKEVTRINGQRFGLKILKNNNISKLKEYLRLRIPALGIDYDTQGIEENGDLLFVDKTPGKFFPRDKMPTGELLIYARISGVCDGTIEPGIVCEWDTAVINTPDDKSIHEKYEIGKNSIGDFPIGSVSFKNVSGYVYMSGMNSADRVNMTVNDGVKEDKRVLKFITNMPYVVDPKTNTVSGSLTPSSFEVPSYPLDMTKFFNKSDRNSALEVDIRIPEMTITSAELNTNDPKVIKCKLCVLIPLDLNVSEAAGGNKLPNKVVSGVNIQNAYVPLDLGDNLQFGSGEDDLFGRTDGVNIITKIEYVDIILEDIEITILDPNRLAVLIECKPGVYELLKIEKGNPKRFSGESIEYPFNPKFTVLLEKDKKANQPGQYEDFGSFKILRPDANGPRKFDFKLYVKAKPWIEYTVDL